MKNSEVYRLTLSEEKIRSLGEESRVLAKLLKVARATSNWSPNLIKRLSGMLLPLGIANFYTTEKRVLLPNSSSKKFYGSFGLYLLQITRLLRLKGYRVVIPSSLTYKTEPHFLQLNYSLEADAATLARCYSNHAGDWYRSQLTVPMNDYVKDNPNFEQELIMIGPVFRRENPDASHSRQFFQLEYRGYSSKSGALQKLKRIIIDILQVLQIDTDTLVLKATHNTFTAPSIEAYVKHKGSLVEILNSGVFLRSDALRQGVPLPEDLRPIGLAFGLDRIYLLKTGIDSLKDI